MNNVNTVIASLGADPTGIPWLNHIINGRKTYEGRLNQGKWKDIQVGSIIEFHDQTGLAVAKDKRVTVISRQEYHSFAEAWNNLGSLLLPIEGLTVEAAEELYLNIGTYREDIKALPVGVRVVVLGIDVLP